MAAPVAAKIILPSDTGNTGKNVRTQTRVVGADTVHEHFFVPQNRRSTLGVYFVNSGLLSARTAADNGTSTGNFWLINPAGSAVKVAVREMRATIYSLTHAIAQTTATRFALALYTATGTPSGATVGYGKRDSTDATPVSTMRTASTGLTVTLGNIVWAEPYHIVISTTAVGIGVINQTPTFDGTNLGDMEIILRAGEGLVCYQPDTSTTTNPRALVNFILEEFE